MGPVDSLLSRGKTCFIMDDTRTGVERDESTGRFGRVRGIRPDDIFEVQKRNFALALSYGLGLIWTDPQSEGWLNIPDQWREFSRLKHLYARHLSEEAKSRMIDTRATLTVVVDEASNFGLTSGDRINTALLQQGREMALRAGVSTRFHLLKDVIEGIAPPTPVYLFLNAFTLSEEERGLLHARLTGEEATAIWLYAPGYFGMTPGTAGISQLIGMEVSSFDEPTSGESLYILSGQYMHPEQSFGSKTLWNPLFYVRPHDDLDFLFGVGQFGVAETGNFESFSVELNGVFEAGVGGFQESRDLFQSGEIFLDPGCFFRSCFFCFLSSCHIYPFLPGLLFFVSVTSAFA